MNRVFAGLVFALITGFFLGWLLKPEQNEGKKLETKSSQASSIEKINNPPTGEAIYSENQASSSLREISKLSARLEKLEPMRKHHETKHQEHMNLVRKQADELLSKLDNIVFFNPRQVELVKLKLHDLEMIQGIKSKKDLGLLSEKEANELLANLPPLQDTKNWFLELLDDDQIVLFEESEYLERRKLNAKRAKLAVERLTQNIDINRNQELQLIESHTDLHSRHSSDIPKYIAHEFEDLQVGDIVKAEISLASEVLTESQLIKYIENQLKRY